MFAGLTDAMADVAEFELVMAATTTGPVDKLYMLLVLFAAAVI